MIITIEIPNDIIYDNVENGDSSFEITLETRFLHKSRKYCELRCTYGKDNRSLDK